MENLIESLLKSTFQKQSAFILKIEIMKKCIITVETLKPNGFKLKI